MQKRLKIKLELVHTGDGGVFLNFWNYQNGDDVVCQVIDGELIQDIQNVPSRTSLQSFIDQVTEKVNNWED